MQKNKIKSGFTLVELMIFFIFISLLMAAATPIITKRVKNLPLKINHGKFICYGGSYELYNATRKVSSGAGCKFTPPKRATLYKIELIGGGAGGYEYYTNPWDEVEKRTGGYKLSGGYYGSGYTNLSEGHLWDILKDAEFTLYRRVSGANAGSSVSRTYTGTTSPNLTRSKECFQSYYYDSTCTRMVTKTKTEIQTVTTKVPDGVDENGNPKYKEEQVEKEVEVEYQEEEEYDCRKFQRDDPNGVLETCSDYDARISAAEAEISSWDNCGGTGGDSWCRTVVGPTLRSSASSVAAAVPANLASFGTSYVGTGHNAYGGSGFGMQLDGKIDYKDYNNGGKLIERNELKSYLSKLFTEYYKKGTTQYSGSSCSNWGYSETNDHTGKFDSKNVGLPDTDSYKKGKWGSEPMYYDAIQGWKACTTNCKRATGGEGGWLSYTADVSISGSNASGVQEGEDAEGLCGTVNGPYKVEEGTGPERIPEVKTETELNVRIHQVGNGGGGASYKVAYVSSLADDCAFNVASGGPVINEGFSDAMLQDLHNSLATTLTCNNGTLRLSADGGYYNNGIYQKEYNGFDYINPDLTTKEPANFTTVVSGGTSPFNSSDVFTKYILGERSYGAGGKGTTITDGCTRPWGQYWINLVYGSTVARTKNQSFERIDCNTAEKVKTTPASSGTGGIIMISW